MKIITEFIDSYGLTIMYAILTAIAGFIATKIKAIYESKVNDEKKKRVVETCVKAVEQLYNSLSGSEKLQRAKENIVEMLNQSGIEITELEMDMLIEAVVAEFNFNDLRIKKDKEPTEPAELEPEEDEGSQTDASQ